jgi:hypothetical protein
MPLKNQPSLPFELNPAAASEWLDALPINNIRDCCRLFYPVLQALNARSLKPQIYFDILEKCRPVVLGLTRDLLAYFIDKPFPLESKNRKIASLCPRLHLELALSYRQIAESQSFPEDFTPDDRVLIIGRALEHLAQSMLRAAQIYEAPTSSILSFAYTLYRIAEQQDLFKSKLETSASTSASLTELFLRIVWFDLAAPNRLAQPDIQHLFDLLTTHSVESAIGTSSVSHGMRAFFCFNPTEKHSIMPMVPFLPPKSELRFLFPENLLPKLRKALLTTDKQKMTGRVLPRLGDRLPCQDKELGRKAKLISGMDRISTNLTRIEARTVKFTASGMWPNANFLQLAPSGEPIGSSVQSTSKSQGVISPSLVKSSDAPSDERFEKFLDERSVDVQVSDFPGFYLLDLEKMIFKVGDLIALNTDDEVIQIGTVRGGQIRNGRFWYGFELLGNQPQLVRAHGEKPGSSFRPALFFNATDDNAEKSIILDPIKWHGGEQLTISWLDQQHLYRIVKLLESTASFCHYMVEPE